MMKTKLYPTFQALLAAALFGVSAPISKALLGEVAPIPMAALLYLGSGAGTWLLSLFQTRDAEAKLDNADIPWLLGALLAGGFAAPIVLMFSLQGHAGTHGKLTAKLRKHRDNFDCCPGFP